MTGETPSGGEPPPGEQPTPHEPGGPWGGQPSGAQQPPPYGAPSPYGAAGFGQPPPGGVLPPGAPAGWGPGGPQGPGGPRATAPGGLSPKVLAAIGVALAAIAIIVVVLVLSHRGGSSNPVSSGLSTATARSSSSTTSSSSSSSSSSESTSSSSSLSAPAGFVASKDGNFLIPLPPGWSDSSSQPGAPTGVLIVVSTDPRDNFRPNVNVNSNNGQYVPLSTLRDGFATQIKPQIQQRFNATEFSDPVDVMVGSEPGFSYHYVATVNGRVVAEEQVVVDHGNQTYVITLATSTAAFGPIVSNDFAAMLSGWMWQ